jgi:hypothetical protein
MCITFSLSDTKSAAQIRAAIAPVEQKDAEQKGEHMSFATRCSSDQRQVRHRIVAPIA